MIKRRNVWKRNRLYYIRTAYICVAVETLANGHKTPSQNIIWFATVEIDGDRDNSNENVIVLLAFVLVVDANNVHDEENGDTIKLLIELL